MKTIWGSVVAPVLIGLAAGPAAGQSAPVKQPQPLRLEVGGYFGAYGVYVSQPGGAGQYGQDRRKFDLKREAEIFLSGSVTLDSGIRVGAHVQLNAQTESNQIDESFLSVESRAGTLLLGATKGASYKMVPGPPSVDVNFDSFDPNYRLLNAFGNSPAANQAPDRWSPDFTGDSEKITYITPKFGGFQAGLSYTPTNAREGGKGGAFGGMPDTRQAFDQFANWSDAVAAGGYYQGKVAEVGWIVGAGYEHGELADCFPGSTCGAFGDRSTWGVYASAWTSDFFVGGGYREDDNGLKGGNKSAAWGVGFNYFIDSWTLGASWLDSRREFPVVGDDRLQRAVVGGRYALQPGLELRGSVQWYGLESEKQSADGDSWAFVLGTAVQF